MKRTIVAFGLVLGLFGCDESARHVRVELDVRNLDCGQGCREHLVGSGIIFQAAESGTFKGGSRMLYAEIYTSSGTLSLIELGTDERGRKKIRYREVEDGEVVFRGLIRNSSVQSPWNQDWTFSFEVYDENSPEAESPARIISSGKAHSPEQGQLQVIELEPRQTRSGSEDRVVIYWDEVAAGCGGEVYIPTDPADPSYPGYIEPGVPVDVEPGPGSGTPPGSPTPVDPEIDPDIDPDIDPEFDPGSSCEGDGGGSSCEGDSTSGCESDSSSGCENDSGSGCEGDSSSSGCDSSDTSGGDCGGCEGDTALAHKMNRKRRLARAARSMATLGWPLFLAGLFNRRRKL